MRNLFLFASLSFAIASSAFASNEKVEFRFEDGYATALLFISGDADGAAARLYEKMKHVNAVDEGIGMAKSWHEQLFQWKCIAKTTGDFACNAKFYDSHPGTLFDLNGRSLSFLGGKEFAQAFIRDHSGFAIGVETVSGEKLNIVVHKESFELTVAE